MRRAARTLLALGAALLATAAAASGTAALGDAAEPTVIKVVARKFEFEPSEITVKKGATVVLELVSEDRLHGFKLPALGVRADVKPGETTRVRITPGASGRFVFRCDVFCGAGHEDMAGTLVVTE